ncbi:signal peptide peptidase SppA [Urechidicola croceus]|uniref:Signal peptide peptidase SppA n=1 Tax=Urechidicola croceus TaxID=1850246 RepID=A0A1D8P7S9_9FLAO|nr:signal peptide peptidase SppA [Urechidicola croceus]AOW20624.1 signal peptide peptidase SppA [Urechidicola croceus]
MNFFRKVLASCLGTSIALILLTGLSFLFFGFLVSALGDKDKVTVKSNSVLELDLSNTIKDYVPKSDNPLDELFGKDQLQLSSVLNAIENAKYDDKIKGISIEGEFVSAGMAQTQAIRNKLVEFKETGKFITSYANLYSQKSYYLSSVADSVFVTPYGMAEFKGLSSERLFYKDFEDKYGVKMEVIRHGKYKSAVEGYLDNKMSDANREQITSFLNSIWEEILEDVGSSRNKNNDELNLIADDLLTRSSEMAVENNMIDGAIFKDQYEEKLKSLVNDDVHTISINNYISTGKGRLKSTSSNTIAIIYAQGDILYGEGDESYIGQESMIRAIRKVRDNNKIKAVVLRIDSPGGIALTADLIWRELQILKSEKPIVVSIGDVAASGGYYMACVADKIYAQPTSITGSIGVFGTIPNFSELVDRIGINAEQVATNKQSVGYSPYEPMTDDFYNVTKEGVERTYETFLKRVAEGRNMTRDAVDSIAQGRVWTGKEAIEIGLIDELGSMEDAIVAAAELAGIVDYKTSNYPRYKKDIEDSFKSFSFIKAKNDLIKKELGEENYKIYQEIQNRTQFKGIQMRLPYIIDLN